MRIALCDDNWAQLRVLEETARECAHWRGARPDIDTFTTGAQLLDAVRSGNGYEYIFLDIEMPELTGIDIYSELFELSHSSIVFVSAYVKYLPEAFALDAFGFLAKPYDQDTFDRTVKSAMDQKAETQFFHARKPALYFSIQRTKSGRTSRAISTPAAFTGSLCFCSNPHPPVVY